MFCTNCNKDLKDCVCPDLRLRLELIANSDHTIIGEDYRKLIEAQADWNERE